MRQDSLAVRVDGVSKRYREVEAVMDVSFEAARGDVVGVLGRNGAGKSTLVSMLAGLTSPTAGRISIFGEDPRRASVRLKMGVVPQEVTLPGNLTGDEFGEFVSAHYPASCTAYGDVFERWGLADFSHMRLRRLSGGQRRRIAVGLAFVGDPDVVILDEPTTGLDPESRRTVWRGIREEANSGVTVMITSHYMDEIECLSDRILLMERGELIEDRPVGEFLEARKRVTVSFEGSASERQVRELADPEAEVSMQDGRFKVVTGRSDAFVRGLVSSGMEFEALRVERSSLEQALLERLAD
ncbi:ABC transporter ATP-binding protein [Actinomyces trachealis]|uniref:ABC transporter ATP-binding protein n=1 Tax=Actinomyces trachealis TaxID=2763540 RepID=UPI0018C57799|nr:ABC transporter ATP-binding protein [Actinomyces trachealis]